jgi:fumarate hydratase subunit beta
MDAYTPRLYDLGLLATIGKGGRSEAVAESIVKNGAVYLCAVGGAGALISKHVVGAREVAMPELGCESIKQLIVKDMPLIVGIDSSGGDIFKSGRAAYARNSV